MGSDLVSSKNFDLKSVIHYARFGRVLKQNKRLFLVQILLYITSSFYFISHLELISYYLSNFSLHFIKSTITKREVVGGFSLYFLSLPGRLPTFTEDLVAFLSTLAILLINYRTNLLPKPFKIWVNFLAIILMISSLYFIFFSYIFPYTLDDFSLLYVIAQVGIMSFIPALVGVSLALFNFSWWVLLTNFFIVSLILVYSFVFGAVRYAIFLYTLKNYSFLWMANMFFNFGPLLDMIYISGIYAFYVSLLSKKTRQSIKVWRWIY